MADAADEASLVIRFVDDERMDITQVSKYVTTFLERIYSLFGPSKLCLAEVGYTNFVLTDMKRSPLVWSVATQPKTLDMPTDAEVNWCLDEMRGWVKLAEKTVAAAFPYFELMVAYTEFDVSPGAHISSAEVSAENCARIAQACDVNEEGRCAEIKIHKPHVIQHVTAGRPVSLAWQTHIQRVDSMRSCQQSAFPTEKIALPFGISWAMRPQLLGWSNLSPKVCGLSQTGNAKAR